MDIRGIDRYLTEATGDRIVPGAVFAAGDDRITSIRKAYGLRRSEPENEDMTANTMFDLASLTKVFCVWPAVMKLLKRGQWQLGMRIGEIDPQVQGSPVENVTIGQLLTHAGGLPERTWLIQYGRAREQIYQGICNAPLNWARGTHVAYSNRGYILLGMLIEKATGRCLADFVWEEVWQPAGMLRTAFNPSMICHTAPTEYDTEAQRWICGTVHDENARVLGGVSGHAGVFSDVDDLSRFCRMIVRGGEIDGRQILDPDWVARSFQNYTDNLNEGRGLAWQKRPGSNGMYRHFGFTGTAIWIEPEKRQWAVLLTNRVHPDRERYASGIQTVRAEIQNLMDR